jgi:hypothetical protein
MVGRCRRGCIRRIEREEASHGDIVAEYGGGVNCFSGYRRMLGENRLGSFQCSVPGGCLEKVHEWIVTRQALHPPTADPKPLCARPRATLDPPRVVQT